ncbi:MAG: SDR family oxidoreductase [Kofleriaceae bacterium]|nr:SDR family oxidoreductase [Kofleriaceae bacterium]MCB9573849.1 SDR family oxidoreductase [Kofleriaceae bacterium]
MKRFDGKIALVTGAASGIGRATALRLAEEGAAVACLDRSEAVTETVAAIEALDRPALGHVADISSEDAVAAAVAAVLGKFDRLDVLCNVAGILRADHTHELTLENWDTVLRVNLTGTFLMCRAALPHLVKTKGCIVNTSSTAALGSHPWMAAYAASKGGILSMTRSIAVEYVKQGVRANCVCPGGVATPLHGQFRLPKGADAELLRGAMPMVAYVGPEHAASVIAFLASDDARYITGTEIRADGGALS